MSDHSAPMRLLRGLMASMICIASATAVAVGMSPLAPNRDAVADSPCQQPPVERCEYRHGRFSTQNGITRVIWLIGTHRKIDVVNGAETFLPSSVIPYLEMTSPDHSYIFGDFEICPIEPDLPGSMRAACVSNAKNLVVQNLSGLRPPFRVRATWVREQK